MAFSEKIRILFDVDAANANKTLKGLRADVSAADGAFGKAKAGAAGLSGVIKENMGTAAIAAGTALVAFGFKAVGVFVDTATAARELGDAVGLSTEDASRWIAVADDMEVNADQLTAGLGKIAKTLDDSKWEKYGISTRDAGGNARKTNDILLDTFDSLGKITNETERAKAGNELFGKGYANLAPLIGKSRAEYEKMLNAVEGGQVITERESEKAERMRLAQDALSDALQEVTLATGEFVANMAPLIEVMAKAASVIIAVQDKSEDLARTLFGLNDGPLAGAAIGFGAATRAAKEMSNAADNLTGPLAAANNYLAVLKTRATDAGVATDTAAEATRKLDEAYRIFTDSLDQEDAFANFEVAMYNYRATIEHSDQTTRDYKRSIGETILALDGIPEETKASLLAQLDTGSIAVVENYLSKLRIGVSVPVRFTPTGDSASRDGSGRIFGATGGIVTRPTVATLGEAGPEAVIPLNRTPGSSPLPGGLGGTTNVYITTGADPRQVVEVIKQYQRRGGVI